jgi:hypothetical protein
MTDENREGLHSRSDGAELNRQIPSVARPQPQAVAILPRDDAKAVVFNFEGPPRPGRRSIGEDGLSGTDETGRGATLARQRRTHQ